MLDGRGVYIVLNVFYVNTIFRNSLVLKHVHLPFMYIAETVLSKSQSNMKTLLHTYIIT
jgi:hypothetical protein